MDYGIRRNCLATVRPVLCFLPALSTLVYLSRDVHFVVLLKVCFELNYIDKWQDQQSKVGLYTDRRLLLLNYLWVFRCCVEGDRINWLDKVGDNEGIRWY